MKNRIGRSPRGTAGTGTTPAAFYLGLCRLRGILSPPASATTNRRRAILLCRNEEKNRTRRIAATTAVAGGPFLTVAAMTLHQFPSSGLKSRIAAAPGQFSGNPCSDCQIDPLKSGIAAATRPFPWHSLQRFPNSPPKIKNHCSDRAKTRAFPASIRKSGPEIRNRCRK